jgi:predicted amidophosphoribosyltransferase
MNPGNCPTCARPWPEKRGRICSVCERPIGRHDRWSFVGSVVQHRDCNDPQLAQLTLANQQKRVEQQTLEEEIPA